MDDLTTLLICLRHSRIIKLITVCVTDTKFLLICEEARAAERLWFSIMLLLDIIFAMAIVGDILSLINNICMQIP